MNLSEQQVKLKPKLKYGLCDLLNSSVWVQSAAEVEGKRFPLRATLDIRDEETRQIYYEWMRKTNWGPNLACVITIGYVRG